VDDTVGDVVVVVVEVGFTVGNAVGADDFVVDALVVVVPDVVVVGDDVVVVVPDVVVVGDDVVVVVGDDVVVAADVVVVVVVVVPPVLT
jgi:hypothetical protein